MNVGLVPTKYGLCAVNLRSKLGKGDRITVHSPVPVPQDVLIQIEGNIAIEAANYFWEVARWAGNLWLVVILFALASALSIYVSQIWGYGTKLALLYGWVRFWFFGEGIVWLTSWLCKWPHRRRVKGMRRALEGNIEVMRENWPAMHALVESSAAEVDWLLEAAEAHPELAAYYKQMLTIDRPAITEKYAFTAGKRLLHTLTGWPIQLPRGCYYVGRVGTWQ